MAPKPDTRASLPVYGETPSFLSYQVQIALLACLLVTVLIYAGNGNVIIPVGFCAGMVFMTLLFRFLPLLIYSMLGAALLLEQFKVIGFENIITMKVNFWLNLNLLTGVGALVMNPFEVVLGFTFGAWFLRAASSREYTLRPIPNLFMSVIFLGMLVTFTAYGLLRHGDFKAALWEIRALYYLCIMYFVTCQLIHTRKQITICVWLIIVLVNIKGLQGCWRYFVDLGAHLGRIETIVGHEDAVFMSTVFILFFSFFLVGYRGREFWVLLASFPFTFVTFIVTQRRVAYAVFGFSTIIIFSLVPKDKKLYAMKFVAPFLPFVFLYTVVFWDHSGRIAMPIQQVRSMFASGDEDLSNAYRELEDYNVEQTIRRFPLGIGFGRKYLIIRPLPAVDFSLWEYIPHNCIYWIWCKTGFFGFTIFWLFFGLSIIQGLINYRRMVDPYFRGISLMVVTFIISQIIVAKYDLQITYYRNMIYLGTCMGLLVAMGNLEVERFRGLAEDRDAHVCPGPEA